MLPCSTMRQLSIIAAVTVLAPNVQTPRLQDDPINLQDAENYTVSISQK